MLIIPFLLLLLFLGLLITVTLKIKVGLVERLSLSYLSGIGIFTFFVFAFDIIFNINYSINNTFSILICLCVILFAIKYKDTVEFLRTVRFVKKPLKWQTVLFWSFVLLFFTYTLLKNAYWPISDWDALAMYDFRAKVLLVNSNLVQAALTNGYFIGYPLLTSLGHLFVYQIGLNNPKFIYSLFYLSFVCIFYYSLKRNISENKAMFYSLLLSMIPEIFSHATMAYTNLPYTIYLCSGVFYLYEWIRSKKLSWLLISAVMVSLSIWVRFSEPFWFVPVLVVITVSFKQRKWLSIIYYLFFILISWGFWNYFTVFMNTMIQPSLNASIPSVVSVGKMTILTRTLMVSDFLYKYVFSTWGLVFLLYILATFRAFTDKYKYILYINLLFFVILFVGTFSFANAYPRWQDIPDSARRMSIFFLPLMIFSTAIYMETRSKRSIQ